jgi:hypothetical protein
LTREFLLLLVGFVLLSGLTAVAMKAYLLYRAVLARRAASDLPINSPERLVADDILLDNSGRIILAMVTSGLGAVFVYAVLNAPPPPNANGTYDINQGSIVLLILLTILAVVEVLQGVRGVVNLQRLVHAMEELRAPPESCLITTFEGCPFVTPERLLEIRATVRKLVAEVEEITEESEGRA